MEEQLKARLIGATVLVVIAVALVPELLSGRKQATPQVAAEGGRGTRTYTIDLGVGAESPRPAEPVPTPAQPVAQETPPTPTVAAEAAPSGDVPPEQADAAAEPVAAPIATAPAAPEPTPAAPVQGRWSVQVGAFGSAEAARKLVSELKRDGFPAYISPLSRSGKTLHRVRVGPAPNQADADRLAARLKARGLPATVVTGG
jgi:DedD protein